MSTDIKLSKAQISEIIQSGGLLGSLLSKLAGQIMKVASAIHAGIQKKKKRFRNNNFNNFKQKNK